MPKSGWTVEMAQVKRRGVGLLMSRYEKGGVMKHSALWMVFVALFLPVVAAYAEDDVDSDPTDVSDTVEQTDAEAAAAAAASAASAATEAVKAAELAKQGATAAAEAKFKGDAAQAAQAAAEKQMADALLPENERGDKYLARNAVMGVYRQDDEAKGTSRQMFCLPAGTLFRIGPTQADGGIAITIETFPTSPKGVSKGVFGNADITYEDFYRQPVKSTETHPAETNGTNAIENARVLAESKKAKRECVKPDGTVIPWADSNYGHVISAESLKASDFKRRGWTFGAVVVPFKYYLGDNKKISSSATVAPYFGYFIKGASSLQFAAIGAVGLGLVPVEQAGGGSETKPALSTALGLLITTEKNTAWNTGMLLGFDLVSDEDKKADPTVNDLWLSLFVGMRF